ncbi:MAG: type II secretion system F family protein [Halodesulfurarchaeum sp.]
MLELLPLLGAGLLLAVLAVALISRRVDRLITRISLVIFGEYVGQRRSINTRQVSALQGAHRAETYRVYAAKTFLYSMVGALVGSVSGVYLFLLLREGFVAAGLPERIPWLLGFLSSELHEMGLFGLFVLLLVSSATFGAVFAYGTYRFRWYLPRYMASERSRRIDATLKRNVAFLYALSRSGMPFSEVLRTLSAHPVVYGETAREFDVTVTDIDLLGADLISALQRTSKRTPNEELEEFTENLASVLQSGGSLGEFLSDQYQYHLEEESAQQDRFVELLGALAEAYVTIFVAGMLFLITILVVIGLLLGGTLTFLQVFVYLVLGLANLGFIVYLDTITEDIYEDEGEYESELSWAFSGVRSVPTSATARESAATVTRNRYRLRLARRVRPFLSKLTNPRRLLIERPSAILWVTIPVGVLWLLINWWPAIATGRLEPSTLDGPLIQSTLFVTGSYAVIYEAANRRMERIEAAIPDFLERFAATNEAGMSMVESFGRVARSDLGALSAEMRRTWADVNWGAHMETALWRFQNRIRTPAITRVVTLATNAMGATNEIGPVLRIAADEAKSARRLERDRYNELITYVVVVYVAFFVFLGIILALDQVFIPSIPTGDAIGGSVPGGGGIGGSMEELTEAKKQAYSIVFFHSALIQGYVSGFVAGQMSDGKLSAGAKHATVMLAIAYGVFVFLG